MPKWLAPAAESRPGRFLTAVVRRYFIDDVARQAAALAYYLLFTLFPFMIFVSSLLGLLALDVEGITIFLRSLLPEGIVELVETYLLYVSQTPSRTMMWFGLVFTIYFPMRASDCLMQAVRRAYRLSRPKHPLIYRIKVLLYTVFLLVTIAVSLFLATVGRRVLTALAGVLRLPVDFIPLWNTLRFVAVGVVMFAALGLLYAVAQDARQTAGHVVPGAVAALAGWLVISAAYSYYVENFANYTVIYGALGTIIVLMVWLNLSAVALIMGAEINGALLSLRGERAKAEKHPRETGAEPDKENDL